VLQNAQHSLVGLSPRTWAWIVPCTIVDRLGIAALAKIAMDLQVSTELVLIFNDEDLKHRERSATDSYIAKSFLRFDDFDPLSLP
jgi:hypothetical protein